VKPGNSFIFQHQSAKYDGAHGQNKAIYHFRCIEQFHGHARRPRRGGGGRGKRHGNCSRRGPDWLRLGRPCEKEHLSGQQTNVEAILNHHLNDTRKNWHAWSDVKDPGELKNAILCFEDYFASPGQATMLDATGIIAIGRDAGRLADGYARPGGKAR
jgi:hypothetical protein